MSESKSFAGGPQGIARSVSRFPISLYRLGWGAVLGWLPMLVMTTKGRRSGLARHVMVEFRRHGSKYYVFSGWGERTDWYRNLLQHPRVTIQHGAHVLAAEAKPVQDNAEALRALYLFTRNSWLYERVFAGMSSAQAADLNSLADVAQEFTLVRLEPTDEAPELPPVELYDEQTRQIATFVALIVLIRLLLTLFRLALPYRGGKREGA
ncbi:MAG: nitroreductase family deazaflavin-dependent oxidoreductase [Chloroflexi bacterium]|nr:nitroreductase family deazaflavin-dependent oxidoreductase [Chloroflexota bacterium]